MASLASVGSGHQGRQAGDQPHPCPPSCLGSCPTLWSCFGAGDELRALCTLGKSSARCTQSPWVLPVAPLPKPLPHTPSFPLGFCPCVLGMTQ